MSYFLQILDNSGSLVNSLSSQDLFHLLQNPQQPLLNSYGVHLVQQPQLQQHFHQQAPVFPPANFLKQEEPVQNNLAVFNTEFKPDYQTFNYVEKYQSSSHPQSNYREAFQEQDESENSPSVTVVRKSPESTVTSFQGQLENQNVYEPKSNSVNEEETYDNTATNPENENNPEDYEESHDNNNQNEAESSASYGGSGAPATSYYTTLPSREAAETLATLAAAGNVNSNLMNHIRNGETEIVTANRGDTPVEEDYVEEEEEEEEESEDTTPQISKPSNFPRPKETEVQETTRFSSEHMDRRPVVNPSQHQEHIPEDTEYVDYSADVDQQGLQHGQETIGNTDSGKKEQNIGNNPKSTNTNLQFGARIRPKRNK